MVLIMINYCFTYSRFRVQVRTTEGVGNWSEPVIAMKAAPGEYYMYAHYLVHDLHVG